MNSSRSDRAVNPAHYAILIFLVILGTALRFYRLDTGLWFDEIVTLMASVRPPLSEIVTHFPGNNDHPLYSVLAHLSVAIFGEHAWSVRLPSAIFGVVTIPLLYWVAARVTSRLEGLLAATILTVSYHHIWFSQNARGYTMLLFCVLLSTVLLIRWRDDGRTANLVGYAVIVALGSYAHLTMVFVCISHAMIYCFAILRDRNSFRASRPWKDLAGAFGGAGLLTVLMYLPMLWDVHQFFTTQTASSNEVATPLWSLLAAVRGLQVGFGTVWVVAAGALIFGAGLWSYFRHDDIVVYLFLLPVVLTLALAVAMSRPIFPRFVFFAVGFGLLITIRGASAIGSRLADLLGKTTMSRQVGVACTVLLTVAAVLLSIRSLPYGYRYPKQDYGQAVRSVEQNKKDGDIVAVIGVTGAAPIVEYLGRPWLRVDRRNQLTELRTKGRDVWVIYTFPAYIVASEPDLWRMLTDECRSVDEFEGTVGGGEISVALCSPQSSS